MIEQQLPQTNEKCYSILQYPIWLFLPPFYHQLPEKARLATLHISSSWSGKVQLTYHKIARTEGDQRLLFPDYYQLVLPFQFLPPQKSNQLVLPASRTLAASTVARHGSWNPSNAFRFGDITVKNLWCQISSLIHWV